MVYLNRFSNYLFIFNLYCSFVFIRFPDIFHFPLFRFVIYLFFLIGLIFGLITSYFIYKRVIISLVVFVTAVFIHAFANFYQPSLRFGISIQNYVLQKNVTSDFEISQTRLYMIFFVCFLFPSITFFTYIIKNNKTEKLSKYLIFSFIAAFILNSFTAIYQGIWNINFLSKGSLTAVDANRAPALLDDSGVASFYFAMMSSAFFVLVLNQNIRMKMKIASFLLFTIGLFSGIINNSRSFYIGFFATIIIFTMFKLVENIINKKYKITGALILISIFMIYLINIYSNYKEISGLTRLKSFFHAFTIEGSLFRRYAVIDEQRSGHLLFMWETIKENFFKGTGLGSFASNFQYQLNKLNVTNINLDVPTNTYLSLISELGIIGLILILFTLYLYFNNIITSRNSHKTTSNTSYYLITHLAPTWAGISFLILAFVSYMFFVPALAYIACCIITPCLIIFMQNKKKNEHFVSYLFFILSFYLLSISVFLAITAPIVPAFQWAKNGHPQTPMPVGSLPQPEGQTQKDKVYFSSIVNGNHFLFKPEGAEEGQWFKPNTEILLLHPKNRIYIGPIKRTYPVNVNITFYSKNGFSIQKNYIITDASWVYFSIPELKEFNSCFNNVSMNSFCYYKINVKPDWQPAFLKTVGFYIEEKYINEPNSWR